MSHALPTPETAQQRVTTTICGVHNGAFAAVVLCIFAQIASADETPVAAPPMPLFQQAAIESARPLAAASSSSNDDAADLQAQKEARVRELERQIREVNERISRLRAQRERVDTHVTRDSPVSPAPMPDNGNARDNLMVPDPAPVLVSPATPEHSVAPADIQEPTTPAPSENTPEKPPIRTKPKKPTTPTETATPSTPNESTTEDDPTATTLPPQDQPSPTMPAVNPSADRVLIPLRPTTPTATFPPRLPATDPVSTSNSTPASAPQVAVTPDEILSGEIDRISLANSLFATGQFEQCLQTLEAILDSTLSSNDRLWKAYLRACCHRSMGNTPEAVRIYRSIVSGSKTAWTYDLALWWLDHINERDQAISQAQELKTVLTEFRKESEKLEKSFK